MITHRGLGSVKERVLNGVPVLVFSLDVDQPGNAAARCYHGIGLRGDVTKTRVDGMLAMRDRGSRASSFQQRIQTMQSSLRQLESAQNGADTLEPILEGLSSSRQAREACLLAYVRLTFGVNGPFRPADSRARVL